GRAASRIGASSYASDRKASSRTTLATGHPRLQCSPCVAHGHPLDSDRPRSPRNSSLTAPPQWPCLDGLRPARASKNRWIVGHSGGHPHALQPTPRLRPVLIDDKPDVKVRNSLAGALVQGARDALRNKHKSLWVTALLLLYVSHTFSNLLYHSLRHQ